jgi:NAD-dependent deacetylase
MNDFESQIGQLAEQIQKSRKTVIFTGAGVSTESGIPDFRSPGGLWDKHDPDMLTIQRFLASEENRKEYWQFSRELYAILKEAEPNDAHHAIVELEKMGKLDCLITQNIDNLHQKAGSSPDKVIELHGTAFKVKCLTCKIRCDREEVEKRLDAGEDVPRCTECGGLLKPGTVSFGEAMPVKETTEAFERAGNCDLLIVLGSSLVVHPAASVPLEALNSGAKLAIVTLSGTPYDSYASILIHESCGEIMREALSEIQNAD